MKKKYFGTDGIRGTVGSFPITADFMLKTGWAAGTVFKKHSKKGINWERHPCVRIYV